MYELELDAAQFFQGRAIDLIKRTGGNYEAAVHDFELIQWFRRKQEAERGKGQAKTGQESILVE